MAGPFSQHESGGCYYRHSGWMSARILNNVEQKVKEISSVQFQKNFQFFIILLLNIVYMLCCNYITVWKLIYNGLSSTTLHKN